MIWQERDVSVLMPEEIVSMTEEINQFKNQVKDTIFDTNSKEECEMSDGIFIDDTCHFYQVLTKLCIKINFDTDPDNNTVNGVYFEDGCY